MANGIGFRFFGFVTNGYARGDPYRIAFHDLRRLALSERLHTCGYARSWRIQRFDRLRQKLCGTGR